VPTENFQGWDCPWTGLQPIWVVASSIENPKSTVCSLHLSIPRFDRCGYVTCEELIGDSGRKRGL
jgi:hypothetical protein